MTSTNGITCARWRDRIPKLPIAENTNVKIATNANACSACPRSTNRRRSRTNPGTAAANSAASTVASTAVNKASTLGASHTNGRNNTVITAQG